MEETSKNKALSDAAIVARLENARRAAQQNEARLKSILESRQQDRRVKDATPKK